MQTARSSRSAIVVPPAPQLLPPAVHPWTVVTDSCGRPGMHLLAWTPGERHAFERVLQAFIEDSGLAQSDEALFDSWEALCPATADEREDEGGRGSGRGHESVSAFAATGKMPYDFSPARLRCLELAEEMAAHGSPAS